MGGEAQPAAGQPAATGSRGGIELLGSRRGDAHIGPRRNTGYHTKATQFQRITGKRCLPS